MTATATAARKVTFKGILGSKELKSYVDPHPGKAASDRIYHDCAKCGGSGYIRAFGHIYGGICFDCEGSGKGSRAVSTERTYAKEDAYRRDYAEEINAFITAEHAKETARLLAEELSAAWVAAHAEDARRSAMVQGFVGEIGDKVKDLVGTVVVAKYSPSEYYNRSATMFLVIKLDNGQIIKTSGSGSSLFGAKRNDKVSISGSVKDHNTYGGQQQTVLIRAKLVRIETTEEEA